MENDLICPECNNGFITRDYVKGHWVCASCGVVLDQVLEDGPEWSAYETDETNNRARTGAPVTATKTDMGLSSRMTNIHVDGRGNKISQEALERVRKLQKIDNRESRPRERNLRDAMAELRRISSQLGLSPTIMETAAQFYRKALDEHLIRGRSINSMIAAAIYAASRSHNRPLTLNDLADLSNSSKKEIARCFRVYVTELNIRPKTSHLSAIISNLCAELKLSMRTQHQALIIIAEAEKAKINIGKNPLSMAAAAVYIASMQTGEKRTQQEVAKAANSTPVTLRTRYREIIDTLGINGIIVKRGGAAAPVYMTPPPGRDY